VSPKTRDAAPPTARPHGAIAEFLRDNWLWILAPIVFVVVLVVVLALLAGDGGDSPFQYSIR
jgi:hypothetical protein